jgi:hypothetical protein
MTGNTQTIPLPSKSPLRLPEREHVVPKGSPGKFNKPETGIRPAPGLLANEARTEFLASHCREAERYALFFS